eukprot:g60564.t1
MSGNGLYHQLHQYALEDRGGAAAGKHRWQVALSPAAKCCLLAGLIIWTGLLLTGAYFVWGYKHPETGAYFVWGYKHPEDTCQSMGCLRLAVLLADNMDQEVDPCQDFYQYSCGGWLKKHTIPDDKSKQTTFSTLDDENQAMLRLVLEAPVDNATDDTWSRQTKILYQSCMDEAEQDRRGAQPIAQLLEQLDWKPADPTSKQWSAADMEKLREKLQLLNPLRIQPLFYMGVSASPQNSSRNVVFIGQNGLGLNKDQFKDVNGAPFRAYVAYLTELFRLVNRAQQASLASQVADFERGLSEDFLSPAERRDPVARYNPQSLQSLQNMAPFLDWKAYFAELWPEQEQFDLLEDGVTLSVESPAVMRNITRRILNTPKETLIYYLQARLLTNWAPRLSKPFRDAAFRFDQVILGLKEPPARWRTCVKTVGQWLGFALDRAFVHKTNGGAARATATEMITGIKSAFEQSVLPSLLWMDAQTREQAVQKSQAVQNMLGFPDWIFNTTAVDAYYDGVELKQGLYAASIKDLAAWRLLQSRKKLGQPVDKTEWGMNPSTVNAYYSASDNQMVFPAGILRPPFYDAVFPKYFNYGALGTVMGHELTHGFDDAGSKYDAKGNLQSWWSNSSHEGFEARASCMSAQYADYALNGKHVNGKLTLGENIADNGGMKQAYLAYQAYVDVHGKEKPLPGLGMPPQQLFFLGMATVWCGKARPEHIEQALSTDPHSPPVFRVNGVMANSAEFSQAFSCAPGTPMNPVKKCQVW